MVRIMDISNMLKQWIALLPCSDNYTCQLFLSQMREIFVSVVVQFCFWFNLDFPLFFSMLIYDNEYQTKENPN